MSAGIAVAVVMSAVAGLAGGMQVAIMGRFGERIGPFEAFAFSTFVTATIAFFALLVVSRSVGGYAAALREPAWLWTGGLMGALIVLAITVASPRIGTTATIGLLIAGQLAMGAVIDRYGLFGFEQIDLSWPRIVGILLLAVGAALSLHRS